MVERDQLLNVVQMATFVHDGMLRFDGLVPRELCDELRAHIEAPGFKIKGQHCPLVEAWPEGDLFRRMFCELPAIQGMIESLVGADPRYDHMAVHTTAPGVKVPQVLHQDAQYDRRFEAFDIQLSVFLQDTPVEMGGTRFLPGSHFRRVYVADIGRYHHIKGMVQTVCPAGTVVVWHHNLWHGAQPNHGDTNRYMVKLRLNPTVKQVGLFDMRGLDDPEVTRLINAGQEWFWGDHRMEIMNKIRLWRSLTGQPEYDTSLWWGRIENEPGQKQQGAER